MLTTSINYNPFVMEGRDNIRMYIYKNKNNTITITIILIVLMIISLILLYINDNGDYPLEQIQSPYERLSTELNLLT